MFRTRFAVHVLVPAVLAAAAALAPAAARADSSLITTAAGYEANTVLPSLNPKGMDVFGDWIAVYADSGLKVYDRATQAAVYDLGSGQYWAGEQYNSFVTFGPGGDSLWVGFTVGGNVDDRIFEVNDLAGGGVWNYRATLPGNYDLAFSGAVAYVSGLGSTSWFDPNRLWRLDTSGSNSHTAVAEVGGVSAGLAFDAAGNLYYGTNLGASETLVRFSAQQVAEGGKTLSDAEILSSLPHGVADVEVDAAGNVLLAINEVNQNWDQLGSMLVRWNGTAGSGSNFEMIGQAGEDHWYTFVAAAGDTVDGQGVAYLADGGAWGAPMLGVAEIRRVPEPGALALVLLGAAAAACTVGGRGRRRR